ncbi:MAG: glycosyltransferase family 2 protein [Roseburia inulinivorans]
MIKELDTKLETITNNFEKISNINSALLYDSIQLQEEPIISVLIITYNRKDLLQEAFKSAVNQKKINFSYEIIIMDNNPETQTVPEYIKKIRDISVKYYVNEKNIGHEGNINRGIQLCRAEWVAMLHDDDLLVHNYLQLAYEYIGKFTNWDSLGYIRTRHIPFSDINEIELKRDFKVENIKYMRPQLWSEVLLSGCGPTYVNSCGSLIRKSIFIKIGGYNSELDPIGDSTLGIIMMNHGYSVTHTETPMGYYRQGNNLSSQKQTNIAFIEADFWLREYLYKKNNFSQIFGYLFRGTQFSCEVDNKRQGISKNKNQIEDEDISYIYKYKNHYLGKIILNILRFVQILLYRPNRLQRRRYT